MKRLIVSTVGTAVLTNRRTQEERALLNQYSNEKDAPHEQPARRDLDWLLEGSQKRMHDAGIAEARSFSAELNGILTLYGGQITDENKQDMHILLATDTWLGNEAAKIVESWLRSNGFQHVTIKRQKDLQTADYRTFQLALSDLAKWCSEEVKQYREEGYHVIFNLTGGFKSVQGFMQAMAPFYADEVIYLFESSQHLMRIPRLPTRMDALRFLEEHVDLIRRLACGLDVAESEVPNIPETLLLVVDEKATLSPWGELVWDQHHKEIYERELLPSPSPRVRFTEKFEKTVKALPPDRKAIINERVDDIVRYLDTGEKYNPARLNFKKLQGNPRPPCTHEIDAWADADARRIFGYYDPQNRRVFVLDHLGEHLG